MPDNRQPSTREMGRYFALAQVGLEMAGFVVVGWLADGWFGWQPWGIIGGAVLGLVMGVTHLAMLSNAPKKGDSSESDRR